MLREVLIKIRDYVPHPSECDQIHKTCNDALVTPKSPAVVEVEGKLEAGRLCAEALELMEELITDAEPEDRFIVHEALASSKAAGIV